MARGGQPRQTPPTGSPGRPTTRSGTPDDAGAGEPSSPVASGASPSGPIHLGNLREFLTPHFVAEEMRRRGLRVRHLHSGTTTTGSARCRPASTRPGPSTSAGRCPRYPTRGAATTPGPSTSRPRCARRSPSSASRWRRSARREHVPRRHLPRADPPRRTPPRRDRGRAGRHRTKRPAPSRGGGAALADSVADDDESGSARPRPLPFKPYCATCGRDTTTVTAYDDDTTDLDYDCAVCGFTGMTNSPARTAASSSGRSTGRCAGPSSASTSSRPGSTTRRPGSSYTVGQELVDAIFDWRAPSRVAYAFVGFAGVQKMSSSSGGVPTAGRRPEDPRGADGALALRAAGSPSRRSTSTSAPRWSGSTTNGTRWAARPPTPSSATPRCWRSSGPRRPRPRARCRTPPGRGPVPGPVLGCRRDRRLGRTDQPDRGARRPPALLRRRPRAAAGPGDGLDVRVRGRRGPDGCARRPTPIGWRR